MDVGLVLNGLCAAWGFWKELTQRWGIFKASPPKVLQAVLQGVYYVVIVETEVAGYFVLEEGEDLHLVHSQ